MKRFVIRYRFPFIFALVYFSLIPIFALVYQSQPKGFYHNTIRYERAMIDEFGNIKVLLEKNIANSFGGDHANDLGYEYVKGWFLQNSNIIVSKIDVRDDGIISFILQSSAVSRQNPTLVSPILLKVVMDVVPQEITNDKNSVFLHYVSSENLYQKVTDGPAFPEKILLASRSRFLEDLSALKFDNDEEKWLVSFVDAYQGFPSKIENSYGRMLYLSAITITTVGFGDIVPITDFCRIMLAFEAILGIIVSGCFVTTIFMVRKDA